MNIHKLKNAIMHPLSFISLRANVAKIESAMPKEIREAHTHSNSHRNEILSSEKCGCFYCIETFSPTKIVDWVDDGECALCPNCGIDSVIGDKSGYPITREFLNKMYSYWFV